MEGSYTIACAKIMLRTHQPGNETNAIIVCNHETTQLYFRLDLPLSHENFFLSSRPRVSIVAGEFKGHGNAFHGRGGWGGSLAQLRMSVRALLSVCRTRDEVALQDLHDQGAIPLLIGQSVWFVGPVFPSLKK